MLATLFSAMLAFQAILGLGETVSSELKEATLWSGSLLTLLNLELFCAMYLPGLGLGRLIMDAFLLRGSSHSRTVIGPFANNLVSAIGRSRRLVNVILFPNKVTSGEWSLVIDWSIIWLWLAYVIGSAAILGASLLDFHPGLAVLATATIINTLAFPVGILILLQIDLRGDASLGYVPRDIALALIDPSDLPWKLRDEKAQEALPSRYRFMLLLKYARALALLICIIVFAVSLTPSLEFLDAALGFDFGPRSRSIVLSIVLIICAVLSLFQFHRRIVDLWQETGFLAASIFSQGFARDSGHQLKNILGPIATGLQRAERGLSVANSSNEEDRQTIQYALNRVSAGRKNVDRAYEWLERLRENSRQISRNRRAWLHAKNIQQIPVRTFFGDLKDLVQTQSLEFKKEFDQRKLEVRIRFFYGRTKLSQSSFSVQATATEQDLLNEQTINGGERQSQALDAVAQFLVETDLTMLNDSISNVLRNAIEALIEGGGSEPDHPRVTVAVRVWHGHTYPVTVSVRDNGHGVTDEDRPYLFDPYVKPLRKAESTGVGLYASREFMLSQGGRLLVSTSKGADIIPSFTTCVFQFPSQALIHDPRET